MSTFSSHPRIPTYRQHKPTGQAVVTLNGRDHYLGKWNTKGSRCEYERLISIWLANGRSLPSDGCDDLTVAELAQRYLVFAKGYYRKNGRPTGEMDGIRVVLRLLRTTFGAVAVREFGPRALKMLRQQMVDLDHSRGYINANVHRICRVFRWGVSEELVSVEVYQALKTLPGLRKGRTAARETAPVRPVVDEVVDATLGYLPAVPADMVRLQRVTGCRPAEICILRPRDVDTSGDVWVYRPESHKTEHHGHERVICIGPKGQDVLRPYLLREKTAYCFSPVESERRRLAIAHANRRTPLSCGNRPGTNRKRRPKRLPGDRYDTNSYRRAIHRAVELANRERKKQGRELLPKWAPNRLRHTAATEIRRAFGLEAAQVALGHSQADVTQIYAEKDMTLAVEVARKIG